MRLGRSPFLDELETRLAEDDTARRRSSAGRASDWPRRPACPIGRWKNSRPGTAIFAFRQPRKVRRTLETAGLVFIDPDQELGPGVRLREGRRT